MRYLLLACACAMMVASPAWACRGTAEYPEVRAQLAKADLPTAEKATYEKKLDDGWALHERGHHENDMELRKKSLEILDEIKLKVGM
jgi:hypothetical protein